MQALQGRLAQFCSQVQIIFTPLEHARVLGVGRIIRTNHSSWTAFMPVPNHMGKYHVKSEAPAPAPAPAAQPLSSLMPPLGASDDGDSVYGGSAAGSDTTLLMSLITRYRKENGRTYHSCGSAKHWGPNDSDAQGQQVLTRHLWTSYRTIYRPNCMQASVHMPRIALERMATTSCRNDDCGVLRTTRGLSKRRPGFSRHSAWAFKSSLGKFRPCQDL